MSNPDCACCQGDGTILADPKMHKWYLMFERTWRLPDGSAYTFPGNGEMYVVVLCPECFPSNYPEITIN